LTKWESFKLFMWDSEKREFMGRTAASWGKVGFFYLVFYAALAAFFAVLLVIFYQTLDNFEPKWQLDSSLIGDNPGLGFRPMPPEDNIESTLIWFRHGNRGNWQYWADELHSFLLPYEDGRQDGEHFAACSPSMSEEQRQNKVCKVPINEFSKGMCMPAYNYGYRFGQPCIAIKINRIFGWKPTPFNRSDATASTGNLPTDLRALVRESPENEPKVWIKCEGENPADRENIGRLEYYPSQGIPAYYFPFKNTPGYLSPIVMVQMQSPKNGVLINIECRAYAKNIEYSRAERKGSVHFEVLVD